MEPTDAERLRVKSLCRSCEHYGACAKKPEIKPGCVYGKGYPFCAEFKYSDAVYRKE